MRRVALLALLIFFPAFVWAAALVNINTADKATLMSLTGLGGTGVKAQAVIDYRTAHGPFAQISDIQNVSGIGPSTYANLKDLITIGAPPASDPIASSTPAPAASVSGGAPTYVPPPSALTLSVSADDTAFLEVPTHFTARVTSKSGAVDLSAQISWSFGDGSSLVGNDVEKVYRYSGTYAVTVIANNGTAKTRDELTITVVPAQVRIVSVSSEGVTIANDSKERLDLSGWRLASEVGSFRFPEGTILLPESKVLFPSSITNLPVTLDASLLYPNGIIAARFAPSPVAQLPLAPESSSQQEVEKIISEEPVQVYENKAVIAPAAAPSTGATAGAPLGTIPEPAAAAIAPEASKSPAQGIFHSVWSYGLLGVIALAGGAFILL